MMRSQISALCRSALGRKVLQSTSARGGCRALSSRHLYPLGTATASISPRPLALGASRNEPTHFSLRRYMSEEVLIEEEFPLFEDMDNLHPLSKEAVKKMGLTTMTEIQAKTFDAASSGKDVLARARTGTGKTMAFLLPALERILKNPVPKKVNVLILSPTRELAAQIADQARLLASTHHGVSYQVMFGGSSRNEDIYRLEKIIPTILVSTPGRLQDHLDNTFVRSASFASLFDKTQVLVLDEMDRLLDMGFRAAVEEITSFLPRDRQTLLFSATLPADVRHIIKRNMKPDFVTVDCIHDEDPASHTNDAVEQSHVILSTDTSLVTGTVGILLNILQNPNAKMICFFPTTKMVKFYSELFNYGLGRPVMELHSGKSQSYRTSASNRFREMKKGVLFTSDVSARGVDYPNVTNVVQVGVSDSRETYIHRLGRTARAGKKGHGLLILCDVEERFLGTLEGLDIPVHEELQELVNNPPSEAVAKALDPVLNSIRNGKNQNLENSAQEAYRGMMGFYNSQLKALGIRSTEPLIRLINGFASQAGLSEIPTINEKAARNMGLTGTPGLNIKGDRESSGRARASPGRNVRGGGGYAGGRSGRSSSTREPSRKRNGGSSTSDGWFGGSSSKGDSSWKDWLGRK